MDELPVPQLFMDIYERLPRQGPGMAESTHRALKLLGELPAALRVADIGCGVGKQTIDLAAQLGPEAHITAVDFYDPFLAQLRSRAAELGLEGRISTQVGDMAQLDFEPASLDVIWSEGAIYLMGFGHGLQAWRPFLAPGGGLVVSEASWLRDDVPEPCRRFWEAEYPAITTAEQNVRTLEAAGYRSLGHFALPDDGWERDYYVPLRRELARLRAGAALGEEDHAVLASMDDEIRLFEQYSAYYGYVFYVMQRDD
ncbi:MAG: methyltransferase domain-containing protein [Deltaproteobacteria bacterium]|nr:methyltransferase domain-containing protein [Deltaproteobacteria bacterium]